MPRAQAVRFQVALPGGTNVTKARVPTFCQRFVTLSPTCSQYAQVFVMDTELFPFYRGEVYHQFHDDMTESYGKDYNALRRRFVELGKLEDTDCPVRFL